MILLAPVNSMTMANSKDIAEEPVTASYATSLIARDDPAFASGSGIFRFPLFRFHPQVTTLDQTLRSVLSYESYYVT